MIPKIPNGNGARNPDAVLKPNDTADDQSPYAAAVAPPRVSREWVRP
jgi:hypothetical protein